MSLWGNNDNVTTASAGVVTASQFNGAVTGYGTTFTNYAVGQTLTLGIGATSGFGVIESIANNTSMQLKGSDSGEVPSMDTQVGTFNGSADAFTVGARPQYLDENPKFAPSSANAERSYTAKVYGVNAAIQDQRVNAGSQYAPTHAGWVGVTTYMDMHGNLRVKSETFVAMSGITTQTQAAKNVLPV
tara:strand:- start:215 stop:775 length:561 start_codon:yes stop_codon:yes gene_type:complete